MSDHERARLLDEFKEMTGTTDEFALSFLDSTEWNMEAALELFLGGAANANSAQGGGDTGPVAVGDDPEITRIMQQHGVDLETARAIKDAGGGSSATDGASADGVRAPILQKRARLFDTEHEEGVGFLSHDLSGLSMHPGAFDAHLRIARGMMQGAAAAAAAPEPPRASRFAPPHWMMFAGTFEEARNEAKNKKRWLIVNIQDQGEFQSLVLNRDLWSDENTQGFIRDSFVFWQQERTSVEAQRFITLYNPTPPYPYVCIIDPRTGERARILKLKKKEDDLRESFFDQIADFLDTSSFDVPTKKKSPAPAAGQSSSSSAAVSTPAAESAMTHDEKELAAAIEASLLVSDEPNPKLALSKSNSQEPEAALKLPLLEPEPTSSNDATVIQFRFADGSKAKRRFLKSSPVAMLFAFVDQSQKVKQGVRFDLLTSDIPSRSLIALADKSLVEADACNQNLLVRLL